MEIIWNDATSQLVLGTFTGICCVLFVWSSTWPRPAQSTTSPTVPAWNPIIGSGVAFFKGPTQFCTKYRKKYKGRAFFFRVFRTQWLAIFDRRDVESIVKSPEKRVSLKEGYMGLVGFAFPKDDGEHYKSKKMEELIRDKYGGKHTVSLVPMVVHAVRVERTNAWLPGIRTLLQKSFDTLPDSGQLNLFAWCQKLISSITVRVMLGDHAVQDEELLRMFVQLFHEADPEYAFHGPHRGIVTLLECNILGERRIYRRVRALIGPIIEGEIRRCLDGKPETDDASVLCTFVRMWHKRLGDEVWQAKKRIANDVFLFTFAAFSNSFAASAWVMYHVIRNTNDVGDQIRAELLQQEESWNTGLKGFACPKLERTILEIVRLYTPGVLLRKLVCEWKMPSTGEIVPAGTVVAISSADNMRDAASFSNPLDFDPSRFGPDRDERSGAGCLFHGFGTGVHPCVGKRFAMFEIAIFASEALRYFDWTVVENNTPDDEFTQNVINVPRHPKVDRRQMAALWRPTEPILVQYERVVKT